MFSPFAYQYDYAGLYAYRLDLMAPQLADLATLAGITVLAAGYLALHLQVMPYSHYRAAIYADLAERKRKLSVAQDLILMKEIQAELEAEMKEDLSREAAQKATIGAA